MIDYQLAKLKAYAKEKLENVDQITLCLLKPTKSLEQLSKSKISILSYLKNFSHAY